LVLWPSNSTSGFQLPYMNPHKDCTSMLIAAIFKIAQNWEQFEFPSVGENSSVLMSCYTSQQLPHHE
jgi:hypothetical protein